MCDIHAFFIKRKEFFKLEIINFLKSKQNTERLQSIIILVEELLSQTRKPDVKKLLIEMKINQKNRS